MRRNTMSISAEDVEYRITGRNEPDEQDQRLIALIRSLERIRVRGERLRKTPVVDDDFPQILAEFDEALDAHRKEFGS